MARGEGALKRTGIARRRSRRDERYVKEFEAARPLVIRRSHNRCEASAFVTRWVAANGQPTDEALASWLDSRFFCRPKASHVHHRRFRSRRGSNQLCNLLHVCEACHQWIHRHGDWANELGLALHADQPESLPW